MFVYSVGVGECYLLCHTLPPEEEKPVGIWGQRYKRCLKEHRKAAYTTLLASGREKSLPLILCVTVKNKPPAMPVSPQQLQL